MNCEDITRQVLDKYAGTQLNIDSEAARERLAKHIASEIESSSYWVNPDDTVFDDLNI